MPRPVYVMAKAAGPACNLACKYCYYLEKNGMYGGAPTLMSDELLETFIRQYIEAQPLPRVSFCWHGGEALLRPLSFYRRALELQQKYAGGRIIENSIQTNGTLLTHDWCRFFRDNGWLVGLSVDGPQKFHDRYRRNRAGVPSFAQVMRGIELLKKHSVEWNGMAVVNDFNADHPLEFYRFFKDIGCRYIQFTPIVERADPASDVVTPWSVTPAQWGEFLCAVFDEWLRADIGRYFVQIFDATLANWLGAEPGLCTMARTCGHAGALEFNGDLYSCDHFVFPDYKLGNIRDSSIARMMSSERQLRFGAAKADALPAMCRSCTYLFACNGECPKNRFARTPDGEPGLNYLCAGYRRFFAHAAPHMSRMSRALQSI